MFNGRTNKWHFNPLLWSFTHFHKIRLYYLHYLTLPYNTMSHCMSVSYCDAVNFEQRSWRCHEIGCPICGQGNDCCKEGLRPFNYLWMGKPLLKYVVNLITWTVAFRRECTRVLLSCVCPIACQSLYTHFEVIFSK